MPNALEWLQDRVGISLLPEDLQALLHFMLLWALLEMVLGGEGGPKNIVEAVRSWKKTGRLKIEPFAESLAYFKQRYFPNGKQSFRFEVLNIDDSCRERVARVLRGENGDDKEIVIAVLLVVNRLRNNLMLGAKWMWRLAGEGDNFRNANAALIAALEIDGRYELGEHLELGRALRKKHARKGRAK